MTLQQTSPGKTAALWFAVAAACVVGAVLLTWPVAQGLDEGIALGTERIATVPLFNLWTLAWNAESFGRGLDGYWQAPIFHPAADTFAFSEPQPVLGFLAFVLSSLGLSILSTYHLLLMGSLAMNGLLATVLFRRLGLSWIASSAGGGLVLALPFSHQELGVIQLVPLAGVLAFALAVGRFADAPGLRSGLLLGLSLALAYGLSAQVAVFCALAATPAALWLWWPRRKNRDAWIGLGAGVALFFALISPLAIAQVRATSDEDFVRSAETVRKHSAKPSHYFETAWPQLVPTPGVETAKRPSARAFWPGTLRMTLALLGAALAWRSKRWRRFSIAATLVLVTSVLLSLGGNLAVGSFSLPGLLGPLPGLGQIRSFFRFALFAQLAVMALAACGIQRLLEIAHERIRFGASEIRRKVAAAALVGMLGAAAVLEMLPTADSDPRSSEGSGPQARVAMESLPPLGLELPWIEWVESETAEGDVLAFFPFPEGRSAGDYLGTSQWMFWQMRHWRPMVGGYSGFFPQSFRRLKKQMEDFPSAEALEALHEIGVRYCLVPRMVIEARPAPDPEAAITLEMVFRDEQHELAIFALRPSSDRP